MRLFIDAFWVNSLPFLHIISEVIMLRAAARLLNREKENLSGFLTAIVDLHTHVALMSQLLMLTSNSNVSRKFFLHPLT